MSTENKDNTFLNQVASTFLSSAPEMSKYYAVAGAAIVGGALYYYLNTNTKSQRNNIIDYDNQTREPEVIHLKITVKNQVLKFNI